MKYPETPLDIGIDFDADLVFYGLRVKPFQPSVDLRFLWLGARHREGLARLESGVRRNAGLILVTGEAGVGKTTLANALIDALGEGAVVAAVRYPSLEPRDFFRVIASAYGLRGAVGSREAFLAEMGEFLAESRRTGRTALLVIDKAQSLSRELWEEIRQLCSLGGGDPETGSGGALNILLVGRQELEGTLAELDLARRLTLRWVVEPLTADEVGAYVAHRLEVAGLAESPFSPEAVRQVWALSGGVPRVVNALCEQALLAGGRSASATIGADLVAQAASRLAAPDPTRERVERRQNGTAGRRSSSGGPRRRAAALAAGLALTALAAVVGAYLWSPDWYDAVLRAAAATLEAEPARDAVPAGLEAAADGRGLAVSPRSGAGVAQPGAEAPTRSAQPASPIPEPAAPAPATAGPGEPAAASRLETSAPAVSVRPVEMVPVLRATPPARPTAKGNAVARRGRALPERPPAPARDESTGAPAAARPPVTPRDAAEGADPDPTAVIDWLLNERAARQR